MKREKRINKNNAWVRLERFERVANDLITAILCLEHNNTHAVRLDESAYSNVLD